MSNWSCPPYKDGETGKRGGAGGWHPSLSHQDLSLPDPLPQRVCGGVVVL